MNSTVETRTNAFSYKTTISDSDEMNDGFGLIFSLLKISLLVSIW